VERALIVRHELPAGFSYLYCPQVESVTDNWLLKTEKIAQKEGAIFLKIDPLEKFKIQNSKLKIHESSSLQPRKTIVLDLQKSEEEILRTMHEKTRYNIRLAERKGVTVMEYPLDDGRPPEIFWQMLQETARRDGFRLHAKSHYEKLLAVRSADFWSKLYFAEYQRKVVAVALVNFYRPSRTATYLHGASSREHKEVMAPQLLHWRIMQEAKKDGLAYYDLWGIDEKRWPGVTRFKKGFGGTLVEYPLAVDIVYRKHLYAFYNLVRKIPWI